MLISGCGRSKVVNDCNSLVETIEQRKLYVIDFEIDSTMKTRAYLFDCGVRGKNRFLITLTTGD